MNRKFFGRRTRSFWVDLPEVELIVSGIDEPKVSGVDEPEVELKVSGIDEPEVSG